MATNRPLRSAGIAAALAALLATIAAMFMMHYALFVTTCDVAQPTDDCLFLRRRVVALQISVGIAVLIASWFLLVAIVDRLKARRRLDP